MIKLHHLPPAIETAIAMVMVCLLPTLVMAEPLTDLHDIVVGTPAQQLPAAGYRDFMCAGRPVAGWSDWASCPINGASGLRPMHIAYDRLGEETKVGGHPVDLMVFFDASGRLARIEIRTDDHVPLFLHKKAYMLAGQAKAHYGEGGWTCNSARPSDDEEPLGSIFINETCTKLLAERRIEVSNRLFRKRGQTLRDFVSETTVSIAMALLSSR